MTDINIYFDVKCMVGVIGLAYQVEEEEEQEGTSAYLKQGISIMMKSFNSTTVA